MHVMVTGGAGYIGSVVTEELLASGHRVVVFDNLSKGHRDAVAADATFVEGDIADYQHICQVLREHRVQAVVHMAADSLVGESVQDPAKYYQSNLCNGLTLLQAMRDCNVRDIVFSSTAAVYGEPDSLPIDETAQTHPTNPYGATKLAFEQALYWYHRAYGMRFVSLRYFNAAGASLRCGERHHPETHLIPLVLQQALSSSAKPLMIYGDDYETRDGTCVRDYIHVVDLARAHAQALVALHQERIAAEIFNLGCGGGYSVRDIIATARRVTNRPIPYEVGPRRPGDPATLIASSKKIANVLGWEPSYQAIDAILESAWKWLVQSRK